jgi:hypothetical protein
MKTDLKTLVKSDKLKTDGAIPSSKEGLIGVFEKCMHRNTHMGLLNPQMGFSGYGSTELTILAPIEANDTEQLDDVGILLF